MTAADHATLLELHRDQLFPVDPTVRAIARELFNVVARTAADLPARAHRSAAAGLGPSVRGPDGPAHHPGPLRDPAAPCERHPLDELGVGDEPLSEDRGESGGCSRELGRLPRHGGRYWLECQLVELFGITVRPSLETADAIYDRILECLGEDEFRPRALYARFGVEVLATTDDPCDDLGAHEVLADDPSWTGRVVPTFRPDRYLEAGQPGWAGAIAELAEASGIDTGDYAGYIDALEQRRQHFIAHGATAADHGHVDARTDPLDLADATRIYRAALAGAATATEAVAFRRHMVLEMARMSCEDGLVMTLHPGVVRSHHAPTAARFGADTGHDIPVALELTNALRPLLDRFGTTPGFHLVVFTVDETLWSRELAPLAGFYPSVFAGAPWWFLDAPDAIRRFRAAIGETAGFSRTAGFVDDTRAFCTIPARHDMSRRIDAGVLAQLVAEHRLPLDEAFEAAVDLVTTRPKVAFKL